MIGRFFKSIHAAGRGLTTVFKTEQNFRIQIVVALLVLGAAWYFPLKIWEWILLILLIVSVLTMEILNTALEYFIDLLKPRLHHYVQIIKDIMAGAVFLTSLGALVVGLLIFLPHLAK